MTLRAIAIAAALFLAGAFAAAGPVSAAEGDPERCPRLMADAPPRLPVLRARFDRLAQTAGGDVKLTFIGHSTFFIESPAGITIATDYNDYERPPVTPRIATMNRAHDTHFSNHPDPGISYLLPGWRDDGQPAHYEMTVSDVWLRNVTTNIRSGYGTVLRDQNSIFVFEVAGLCIAHLGHLHQKLTRDHLKALGRIDVVLVPVDGNLTLNVEDMVENLAMIQAPLVIPMHYFERATLQRFLNRLGRSYEIKMSDTPSVTLSRASLPKRETVLVLPGD